MRPYQHLTDDQISHRITELQNLGAELRKAQAQLPAPGPATGLSMPALQAQARATRESLNLSAQRTAAAQEIQALNTETHYRTTTH